MFSPNIQRTVRLFAGKKSFSTSASESVSNYARNYSSAKRTTSTNQQKKRSAENHKKLRKPSIPFRDYEPVKRNAMGVFTREDVALDSFLSRHRPIFLMDISGEHSRTGANSSPWFQTASGKDLNKEMKNVPEDVVDRLKPFELQKPLDDSSYADMDPLLSSSFAAQLEKSLNLKIKDVEVLMPSGESASLMVVKGNEDAVAGNSLGQQEGNKNSFDNYFISTRSEAVDSGLQYYQVSPASDSFLRPAMQVTSVMRKRRIKMNRHKYKKRRKAQRAMRRKLNK